MIWINNSITFTLLQCSWQPIQQPLQPPPPPTSNQHLEMAAPHHLYPPPPPQQQQTYWNNNTLNQYQKDVYENGPFDLRSRHNESIPPQWQLENQVSQEAVPDDIPPQLQGGNQSSADPQAPYQVWDILRIDSFYMFYSFGNLYMQCQFFMIFVSM